MKRRRIWKVQKEEKKKKRALKRIVRMKKVTRRMFPSY